MALFWHRRDLRLADNVGLAAATGGEPVVSVFVFDPDVLDHASPPRVAFMCDALRSLRAAYRERGSDLVVAEGDPCEIIPDLSREHGADRVVWNRDYSGLARERDARVRRTLDDAGIAREAHHDAIHHEPGSITTNEGEIYSVYTYFWKKWRDRPKEAPVDPPAEGDLAPIDGGGGPVPSVADLGFDDPEADVPEASTDAARERLRSFCAGPIYEYAEKRDYPAAGCTSRLSAHLSWGTIGPREVYAETDRALADAESEDARESVSEFQSQLAWREFYAHVLWDRPDVVTANYKDYENELAWRDDPDALQAWKDGDTGYPIVDAGMRQLRAEAYMHNRVRMIVASFLTKDLLLDWRAGYDWFRRRLVDHDTANDTGGWQWAASTGTDAQPYFRIFNPMTQGERYDPDAEYIKEHVPELRGVPADAVHSWHELDPGTRRMHAPDYPDPIVDHAERREEALAMFEAARGG
ncbi:MAG: deoxyribodipyrimidine photo-lyase [Halobacteriales archaeon]